MDIILLFLFIVLIVIAIALFYGILTGKLDENDVLGMAIIVIGVIGIYVVYYVANIFSMSLQEQYDIIKAYIESIDISDQLKEDTLLYSQQIVLSGQESLYLIWIFSIIKFIVFIIIGLIALIGRRLIKGLKSDKDTQTYI